MWLCLLWVVEQGGGGKSLKVVRTGTLAKGAAASAAGVAPAAASAAGVAAAAVSAAGGAPAATNAAEGAAASAAGGAPAAANAAEGAAVNPAASSAAVAHPQSMHAAITIRGLVIFFEDLLRPNRIASSSTEDKPLEYIDAFKWTYEASFVCLPVSCLSTSVVLRLFLCSSC